MKIIKLSLGILFLLSFTYPANAVTVDLVRSTVECADNVDQGEMLEFVWNTPSLSNEEVRYLIKDIPSEFDVSGANVQISSNMGTFDKIIKSSKITLKSTAAINGNLEVKINISIPSDCPENTYTLKLAEMIGSDSDMLNPSSIDITVQESSSNPPSTPTLNDPGTTDTDGSYTVSWSSVSGATNYTLEEDTSGSFGSPDVVYSGPGTSKYIAGRSDGTYYYRVKACNACGCSGWSNVGDIEVEIPSENIPPVASFTYSPLNPVVGQMVAFDLSSSCDPDGQITHYRLDFGDESGTEGPGLIETIGHEYSSAGNYIVTLTVTDDYGATGTETKTVIVTLTVSLIGDLNHDGILTPADAAIALQIAACGGWDPAADMNSDDCITSLDALMILSMTPTTQSSREPPCDSYGDVDDDSYVTVDDYDLVRSYAECGWDAVKSKTGLTSEEEFKRRADIDGDDKVSFSDSVFIDHYINGTRDTFPLCP